MPSGLAITSTEMANGHWRRWFARTFDFWVMAFALGIVAPGLADTAGAATNIVVCLIMVPLEAGLLSEWGRTPGKYFMALKVIGPRDRALSFKEALRRSSGVAAQGVALGIAILTIATTLWQLNRHKKGLAASYEIEGCQVVGDPALGTGRTALAGAVLLGILYISWLGLQG